MPIISLRFTKVTFFTVSFTSPTKGRMWFTFALAILVTPGFSSKRSSQCMILTNSFEKWMIYPVVNFLSFAMKETRFFKMKWCLFADLLDLTLWFLMILSRRCIVILKTRLLLPLISLFWFSERERSLKMSLQCAYSRILELITSGNVILWSPSFNKKTTAGFEGGGGVMVLTPKYTFYKHLLVGGGGVCHLQWIWPCSWDCVSVIVWVCNSSCKG